MFFFQKGYWGPYSYMFLWYSRKGGGLSTGSQYYSMALTLLVRWDFNAPTLYINVRLLSRRHEPKRSRGNFQWNYQEMFLNGETNCETVKESLGEKEWFSLYESHFVELDKEVNNIQEGKVLYVWFMDLEEVLAADATIHSASLIICCQQGQIQDPQHLSPAT